jgi:hypothetical protein
LVLPTLGFVLTAYLLYALFRAWSRHHYRQFQPYRGYRRKGRLGLVGGTGVGLGIIILIAIVGFPSQDENLRTASIITASWGYESQMPGQGLQRQEILPIKNQSEQGQPAYAYLHPETPVPQLLPQKKGPRSRSLHKSTLRNSGHQGKAHKVAARVHKKKKAATKARPKKKKANAPAEPLAATSG